MRFTDRRAAGEALARKLEQELVAPGGIVLALPRGGVPVGFEVARRLKLPLDVFIVRKLGAPGNPELAMGAIASGGVRLLNPGVVQELGVTPEEIETATRRERAEIERRERVYRAGQGPLELRGRQVILVDDGLATGATMRAAVAAVKTLAPERVIVAVPVAARSACEDLARVADAAICLELPEPFHAVGEFYDDFAQTTDAEVTELLRAARAADA